MNAQGIEERTVSPGLPDSAARANMYGFLAAVFLRPPDSKMLQCLSEIDLFSEISQLHGRDGLWKNPEVLGQEYMDLFAVPTGRYVFPFEDVYRGTVREGPVEKKGPLLGPCAVAVKVLYRRAGAQVDSACRELPTQIGVELSFMSFLCQKEAEADGGQRVHGSHCLPSDAPRREENRRLQIAFLTEHLNRWFPQLSLSIQAKASIDFYRALALLTERFLTWDATHLLESTDGNPE